MAYTKNKDPWAASDLVTIAIMDNFETIYAESSSYLSSHTHDGSYYTKSEMEAAFWYSGNDGSGSGSDADLIYKSTGNLHAASFSGLGVATGLIVLWYGSVASIPAGWHLCDGTGGTIDLRGRFVVGAGTGSDYSVGNTGGSATFTAAGTLTVNNHTLTVDEIPSHRHPYTDRKNGQNGWSGAGTYTCRKNAATISGTTASNGSGNEHGHSAAEGTGFTGDAVACLPYYYALAYIQKV